MGQPFESKNKGIVLQAFDTLFNKRDYETAERYWSPNYIQHSAHIPPGRDGLFNLIKSIPPTLRVGNGCGRRGLSHLARTILGPRLAFELDCGGHSSNEGWVLVEHWDVIQDEATRESSKSGLPMFGERFGG
jgi:predicted SnoaL-like aldol condensation-catalyzing enzyme